MGRERASVRKRLASTARENPFLVERLELTDVCEPKGNRGQAGCGEETEELSAGGRDGDPQFLELGPGEAIVFASGKAPNDFAKVADARALLPQLKERQSAVEQGGGQLEALGVVVEDLVVFRNGLLIVFLLVGNFTDIELGVGCEIGVAVMLQVVLKLRARQIIFSALNVAQAIGVESIGGNRRHRRGSRARGRREAACRRR